MLLAKQIIYNLRESLDFSIGDTVGYSQDFLKSVNVSDSKKANIQGKITGLEPTGHGNFVYVTWSDGKKTKSLANNLEVKD